MRSCSRSDLAYVAKRGVFARRTGIVSHVSASVDVETGQEQKKRRKMSGWAVLALHDNRKRSTKRRGMKGLMSNL